MAENYHAKSAVDLVRLLLARNMELPEGAGKPEIIALLKDFDKNPSKYQKEGSPPAPPPNEKPPQEVIESVVDAINSKTAEHSGPMTESQKLEQKYKNLPRKWVRVTQKGLGEGQDFSFTTDCEGCGQRTYHLINGAPVNITEKLIEHLLGCNFPKIQLQQGEAGTPVRVYGREYRFAVEQCDAPVKSQKIPAVSNVQ